LPAALAALSLTLGAAADDNLQSHDQIREAVRAFVAAELDRPGAQIQMSELDPRLRLTACDQALACTFAPGAGRSGRTTVGVRCPGSRPWTIYVPVTVRHLQPVVVLTRPGAFGEVIGPDDVRVEPRDVSQLPSGHFSDPAQVLGQRLTRAVAAGQPLPRLAVATPVVVKRGQRVSIIAATGGVEVRMAGTALADGGVGDTIRVRNLSSAREVEGVVDSGGQVRVRM
jgi:flagella basal body P-ring formation protein FlgA